MGGLILASTMSVDEIWGFEQLNTFQVHAAKCGLDMSAAMDDAADATDEADEAVAKPILDRAGGDVWDLMAGNWSRWWSVFLRQYGAKCVQRWRDACGNENDYVYMERLWAETFVPLQMAGCDLVKQVRLKKVKQAVARLPRSGEVSAGESKALVKWAARLDSTLSKLIASHTELQKQAISRGLRERAAKEEKTSFGKIRRFIPGLKG